MNVFRKKLFTGVIAATLGLSALTAQAQEPTLTAATASGATTTATFTGGATINNGSTYTNSSASSAAVDVTGTINVAASDVGKTGSLIALVQIPGVGAFKMVSGGLFLPWDGKISGLSPFAVKKLGAQERFTVIQDLIGANSNLAGLDFQVYFGYYTGNNINTLAYTSAPVSFSIAATPAAGCPTNTRASNTVATYDGKPVCVMTGTLTTNTHLNANNVYLLDGAVFVGRDNTSSATLTIDAGTKVIAPVGLNFLVVSRGSKIAANGSESAPIIFTYDDEANATATTSGRWGGLIINGNAPVNGCAAGTVLCELEGEGSTGKYGGNVATDSSGVLSYVIVKYPGQNITPTNELNGIAFQGVGSGTTVDYVQVHNSSDDGIEFFGGSVNAKHLILTGNEDDSFDWTFGWNGKVQHAVLKQRTGNDRGIEADNNEFAFDSLPRSKPMLANFTLIGKGVGGRGMELRRGTGANIHNTVVTGFDSYCLDINDNATFLNGGATATTLTGQLTMTNTRFACANNFSEASTDPWAISAWFNGQAGNSTGTADLSGVVNGPTLNALAAATLTDAFFDKVTHIGAVKSATTDWTAGWMFGN
jgi:hypothetical protein